MMIYNGMQFLGVPFETIIKGFRRNEDDYETVEEAANKFLTHLYKYVDGAPEEELFSSVAGVIGPVASLISERINGETLKKLNELIEGGSQGNDKALRMQLHEIAVSVLEQYEETIDSYGDAEFITRNDSKKQSKRFEKIIDKVVDENISRSAKPHRDRIIEICTKVLKSNHISQSKTGLVFAGFGSSEIFPTLISFEIDSVFEMKIRNFKTEHCDIDRKGQRALVRPFAQKEMVDRFLHGLDDRLKDDITKFCRKAVNEVADGIIGSLVIGNNEREELEKLADQAERAFIDGLNDDAFTSFQDRSRIEIESMVEFMPKPELAKMAEALIDLTSIKRKVSQQLETVGGPVDVAVISKNDGFVWVKRKHYFPKGLNSRYFTRNKLDTHEGRILDNEQEPQTEG